MNSGHDGRQARDPLVGRALGGCLLRRRIGRGGMGSVYLASRQADGRKVAIKILAPYMAENPAVLARFSREIRAASRVRSPQVIHVMGSSEEDGVHFSIMEYIDGENLADLLKKEGRLTPGHAAFIAREVARGLSALHAEGILHRDVKPSNILIGRDGTVKLTDFGIARDMFELQRLTAPGDLLGTLGFAAPEQLERSEGDLRADLYSLGATLHCMLSGLRPRTGENVPLPPDVPQALGDLTDRLLSRDPADRPPNAASVASALHAFAKRPDRPSIRKGLLRTAMTLAGGLLAFWAGAFAASSRGPEFRADPWAFVLPLRGSVLPSAALFGTGVLVSFFALIRGRERMGLGLRCIVGLCFLAGALVVAYMAGAAAGTVTWRDAARALTSCTPELLFAEPLLLAALGSLVLAAAGVLLACRHRGRLWPLLLAPSAVLAALGLFYRASLESGAPSLREVVSTPEGEIALAILLAFAARALLGLPGSRSSQGADRELDTTASSATPAGTS